MRVKTINTAAQGTAPGPEARPNQAPNRRALPLESRDNTPKRHRGIRALWRDGAGAPYPRSQRALWRKAGAPVPLRPAPQQSATGPPPRILSPHPGAHHPAKTCTYLCAAYPWGTGRPRRWRGHGVVGRLQKPLPVPLVLVKDGPLLRGAFVAEGPSEQTPLGAGLFSILASLLVAARGGPLRREQAEGPDERGHLPKLKHGRRSFLSRCRSLSLF